jgi:hypothetical protein
LSIEVPTPYETIIKFEVLDKKFDFGESLFTFKDFENKNEEYDVTLDIVLNGKNTGFLEIKFKVIFINNKDHKLYTKRTS